MSKTLLAFYQISSKATLNDEKNILVILELVLACPQIDTSKIAETYPIVILDILEINICTIPIQYYQ